MLGAPIRLIFYHRDVSFLLAGLRRPLILPRAGGRGLGEKGQRLPVGAATLQAGPP
jgi:hypothetical protein